MYDFSIFFEMFFKTCVKFSRDWAKNTNGGEKCIGLQEFIQKIFSGGGVNQKLGVPLQ